SRADPPPVAVHGVAAAHPRGAGTRLSARAAPGGGPARPARRAVPGGGRSPDPLGRGGPRALAHARRRRLRDRPVLVAQAGRAPAAPHPPRRRGGDRKSTRLNSSHVKISYAVFCLK